MAAHLLLQPSPKLFTTFTSTSTKKHSNSNYLLKIRAVNSDDNGGGGGDYSYLTMWKKAKEREKKELEFLKIAQNSPGNGGGDGGGEVVEESPEVLEKKSSEFHKILQVSKEERDRVQRMQVVDRAAAAIAAARALLQDSKVAKKVKTETPIPARKKDDAAVEVEQRIVRESSVSSLPLEDNYQGTDRESFNSRQSRASGNSPPGPDFWTWTPPLEDDSSQNDFSNAKGALKITGNLYPKTDVIEKEKSADILSIPFESRTVQPLPPFQSLLEVHKVEDTNASQESSASEEDIGAEFSAHAAAAADALYNVDEKPSYGIHSDGSRWWRETGIETRPDGVVCRWTLNRGVTADGVVEWEEKYWEAADDFKFKELGSEKSGRDAMGNVWHEYWKESMWQERGLLHMEKTADKWGKNGKGDEWREKWWEQYDASGKTDKWAHKWCSIDPNTEVEVGHAHVWHERWGEKYDGQGGSVKYTDKWAERCEGEAWVKWGDKWDEHFDPNSHGVKQGETWWQGKYGEQWNRTWGEHHNGSGWVHKYGKSSSGEHWDTHVPEDTWYEKYPHFGFMHCYENSVQLREVTKPSENS